MKHPKPKPSNLKCPICGDWYEPTAPGSLVEIGTGRRFCPACGSDILRTNGITEHDFMPGDDHKPDTLPIDEFIPEE
jgi:hypothetical protein